MSNKYAVMKNNYVIDYIVVDDTGSYQYPNPYDFLYHDVDDKSSIGAWYEQPEDIFYMPIKVIPSDSPFSGSFILTPEI